MSPCYSPAQNVVVCSSGPMKVVHREPDGEDPRWCFQCRRRVLFELIVTAPEEISYYEPNPSICCVPKGHTDGDMFPGRYREWSEP